MTEGALAENPEVARAVGERDREGRERPHCLVAILSWNQFSICRSRASFKSYATYDTKKQLLFQFQQILVFDQMDHPVVYTINRNKKESHAIFQDKLKLKIYF